MALEELTYHRSLTISVAHREAIQRGYRYLTYIDIDGCEYCSVCRQPLALMEYARYEGKRKEAKVTRNLAQKAGVIAGCFLYEETDEPVVEAPKPRPIYGLSGFPSSEIFYPSGEVQLLKDLSREEWWELLADLRRQHQCTTDDNITNYLLEAGELPKESKLRYLRG